jgi:hypothetical protein
MHLRAGLDSKEKRTISCPCRESNPGHPTPGLVAISTQLSQYISHMNVKLGAHFSEEHSARAFDSRVLRRIFGTKRESDRWISAWATS